MAIEPNDLRTKELLDRTGISRQVLQHYIAVGLVKERDKTRTGRRLFGEEMVKRIKLIRKLNKSGYTLRDIRDVFKSGMR
jgi:MerR family mercuric resistance operon transcriptional regulator